MNENFKIVQDCRRQMRKDFGFHVSEEFHTKHLITDKKPFSKYEWSIEERKQNNGLIRSVKTRRIIIIFLKGE